LTTGEAITSSDPPASEFISLKAPSTAILINALFANYSKVFKPLDDLLGCPSSSSSTPCSTQTPDRFADVNYFTLRLEIDMYSLPKGFTKQREKEFAEEAAEYVKAQFFPKLNERFEKVGGEMGSLERRGGGFGVVVTPRSRTVC
jgi:hypothetical protein